MDVGARILVIDDDQSIRECVVDALEDDGYRAAAASNGVDALALIEAQTESPFDLILLDMWMPVMNGWRFADDYRRLPGPHAPIVVFSADGCAEAASQAEQIKAAGFVTKPFDLQALESAVARCLSKTGHAALVEQRHGRARSVQC